jgi:hypothetical protein
MADSQDSKLSALEEVKLDAEFNFKQRLAEQEAKAKHEEEKLALRASKEAPKGK